MRINDKILKSIKSLPPFPATIQRVTGLLNNPDTSLSELVNVIKLDQSITANILKMVNSAYFGLRHEVDNVNDAVMYLGRKNIMRAVLPAGLARYFKKTRGYEIEAVELWEHSVGVALMCQILSKRLKQSEDQRLFTAAILHDIGKVVLGEFVHESFQKIQNLVTNQNYSFLEAEEEVLGVNHADLGGEIAFLWKFPVEIRETIAYHHRPDLLKNSDGKVSWMVYLADQTCLMMGIGTGTDGLAYRGLGEVISMLGVRQRELEETMVDLFKELKMAKELVNIVSKPTNQNNDGEMLRC